jgi:hypothetical protein
VVGAIKVMENNGSSCATANGEKLNALKTVVIIIRLIRKALALFVFI